MSDLDRRLVLPDDPHNRELLSHVRPPGYENPRPSGRYNLVVIGGGTAGLVAAIGAAELGARVALVERHLLGGDRLNVGCVPSKALLRAARAVADVRDSGEFGVRLPNGYEVDFPSIMDRMRRLRARISPVDGIEALTSKGVDVYLGEGRFVDSGSLEVDGTRLEFARAVIATGARAARPPIPGIDQIDVLTNENLFWLTELPRRLAVIGSGPIGAEMAQAFARFGSEVTVYDISPDFMPRADVEARAIVQRALARDGVRFRLDAIDLELSGEGDEKRVRVGEGEGGRTDIFDEVLVAVGRVASVEGLNLDAVGVRHGPAGIEVNDRLRTTNSRIFACGDVASEYKFTHAADALARIVIGNALFFGFHRASALNIPWTIYTDPELAHVGVEADSPEMESLETITVPFAELDRAILDGEDDGLIKIRCDKKGCIRGATIVGPHAGEMIGEIVLAMNHRVRLGSLAFDIHPYPTQAEVIKKCGDAHRRQMLTPNVTKTLGKLLEWRR